MERIKKLRAVLRKEKLDAALFFSAMGDPNYTYFSNTSAAGVLVISSTRQPLLITNRMEYHRVLSETWINNVLISDGKKLSTLIKEKLPGIKTVGINASGVSLSMFRHLKRNLKLKFRDIGAYCEELRAVKREEEIKLLEKACRATTKVMESLVFSSCSTEASLAAQINSKIIEKGMLNAFDTIVAAGTNSSIPHHLPGKSLLKGCCIIDFGANIAGYCSDFTRTLYFGKPNKQIKQAFGAVLNSLGAMLKLLKPGLRCSEIAKAGLKALRSYKRYVVHAFGHGVGLEVHENPAIATTSKLIIKKGMVLAVEPGIYIPGRFGVRLEDTVLVTDSGAKVLTKSPRELRVISQAQAR